MSMISRWVPVYTDTTQQLGVMSIGFLLQNQDDPVVWRGPKKTGKLYVQCFVYIKKKPDFPHE